MRLIDADALYKYKVYAETPEIIGDFIPGFVIDKAPTIDAVPVVHARWIEKRMAGDIVSLQCSMCGNYENPSKVKGNYCWQCGARMDG